MLSAFPTGVFTALRAGFPAAWSNMAEAFHLNRMPVDVSAPAVPAAATTFPSSSSTPEALTPHPYNCVTSPRAPQAPE